MFNIELTKIDDGLFKLEKSLTDGTIVSVVEGDKKTIIEAALNENIIYAEKIVDTLDKHPANYFTSSTVNRERSKYVH